MIYTFGCRSSYGTSHGTSYGPLHGIGHSSIITSIGVSAIPCDISHITSFVVPMRGRSFHGISRGIFRLTLIHGSSSIPWGVIHSTGRPVGWPMGGCSSDGTPHESLHPMPTVVRSSHGIQQFSWDVPWDK